MAQRRVHPPNRTQRQMPPRPADVRVRPYTRQAQPAPNRTGKALAIMLGLLFVAVVLVGATKGFGALGHPLLGLLIGIAVLALSGLLYWRQVKLGESGPKADGS
jgi:hypothetical protein